MYRVCIYETASNSKNSQHPFSCGAREGTYISRRQKEVGPGILHSYIKVGSAFYLHKLCTSRFINISDSQHSVSLHLCLLPYNPSLSPYAFFFHRSRLLFSRMANTALRFKKNEEKKDNRQKARERMEDVAG